MPLLDQNGLKADAFRRLPGAELADHSHVLVPLADYGAARMMQAGNQQIGVEIANTVRVPDLADHLDDIALVAISFPSFSDGRGFSIAKSLRNAGYRGTLRAVGPLIADQFAYALACGFDEVELPDTIAERQPEAIWLAAARAIRATYQRGHGAPGANILDARRAARTGEAT